MASALSFMDDLSSVDLSYNVGPRIMDVALDTAVGAGTSYGLGQAVIRYGDTWVGKHAPTIAAVVGKLGAIAVNVFAHGTAAHWTSGALNSVGQAGVNARAMQAGIDHALKATGQKVAMGPADQMKALGGKSKVVLGAGGRGLSWEQLEELAQTH